MNGYYRFLIGLFITAGGLAWIIEHWLTWGYLEFEVLGHETFGLTGVIIGIILMKGYLHHRLKKNQ